MRDRASSFDRVWKQFRRGERHDSLRDLIPALMPTRCAAAARAGPERSSSGRCRTSSFEVRAGEALGIIGRNGAGKSTMLKLLTRILKPTRGPCASSAASGALIEVAAGFHPDLTGRENVFLQGAIMGMRRAEIAARFDEIVDVRRRRAVHRHAGQALLERHERPARLLDRGAPRPRRAADRRSAGGRRHGVPGEVPGAHEASSSARASRSCSCRTTCRRSRSSAARCCCSSMATRRALGPPARSSPPTAAAAGTSEQDDVTIARRAAMRRHAAERRVRGRRRASA